MHINQNSDALAPVAECSTKAVSELMFVASQVDRTSAALPVKPSDNQRDISLEVRTEPCPELLARSLQNESIRAALTAMLPKLFQGQGIEAGAAAALRATLTLPELKKLNVFIDDILASCASKVLGLSIERRFTVEQLLIFWMKSLEKIRNCPGQALTVNQIFKLDLSTPRIGSASQVLKATLVGDHQHNIKILVDRIKAAELPPIRNTSAASTVEGAVLSEKQLAEAGFICAADFAFYALKFAEKTYGASYRSRYDSAKKHLYFDPTELEGYLNASLAYLRAQRDSGKKMLGSRELGEHRLAGIASSKDQKLFGLQALISFYENNLTVVGKLTNQTYLDKQEGDIDTIKRRDSVSHAPWQRHYRVDSLPALGFVGDSGYTERMLEWAERSGLSGARDSDGNLLISPWLVRRLSQVTTKELAREADPSTLALPIVRDNMRSSALRASDEVAHNFWVARFWEISGRLADRATRQCSLQQLDDRIERKITPLLRKSFAQWTSTLGVADTPVNVPLLTAWLIASVAALRAAKQDFISFQTVQTLGLPATQTQQRYFIGPLARNAAKLLATMRASGQLAELPTFEADLELSNHLSTVEAPSDAKLLARLSSKGAIVSDGLLVTLEVKDPARLRELFVQFCLRYGVPNDGQFNEPALRLYLTRAIDFCETATRIGRTQLLAHGIYINRIDEAHVFGLSEVKSELLARLNVLYDIVRSRTLLNTIPLGGEISRFSKQQLEQLSLPSSIFRVRLAAWANQYRPDLADGLLDESVEVPRMLVHRYLIRCIRCARALPEGLVALKDVALLRLVIDEKSMQRQKVARNTLTTFLKEAEKSVRQAGDQGEIPVATVTKRMGRRARDVDPDGERNWVRIYLQRLKALPPDTRTEGEAWKDYRDAPTLEKRQRIALRYVRWVEHRAIRMSQKLVGFVDPNDLFEYGMAALWEDCIDEFDPARDYSFTQFAIKRVDGAMTDGLRVEDFVPRLVRNRTAWVEQAKERIYTRFGIIEPDNDLLRVEVDRLRKNKDSDSEPLDDDEWVRVLADGLPNPHELQSLDEPLGHKESPRALRRVDDIEDVRTPSPSEELSSLDLWLEIQHGAGLDDREFKLLLGYYREEKTMKEIGRELDLSESRVSQLHSSIIDRIKSSPVAEVLYRAVYQRERN